MYCDGTEKTRTGETVGHSFDRREERRAHAELPGECRRLVCDMGIRVQRKQVRLELETVESEAVESRRSIKGEMFQTTNGGIAVLAPNQCVRDISA